MSIRKPKFVPNLSAAGTRLDLGSLRAKAQNDPQNFADTVNRLVEKGLRFQDIRDVRGLYGAYADVLVDARVPHPITGECRTVSVSAFPLLSSSMMVAGINDAYEAVPTIGQDLVTDTESNKRVTEYASILTEDRDVDLVREGEDFPEIGAGEERYEIRSRKNGRLLKISMETIRENDVPNIVERINALGEIAAEMVEEQTLYRVTDHYGSGASPVEPYAFRLNGSGTQLYNSTANNPGTRAPSGTRVTENALTDTSDLEAVRTVLAAMLNSRSKRIAIPVNRMTLLVPDALAGTALKIQGSELEPGVENELNNWGPRGRYRPRFRSSPKLDDLSTSAWYLGWFERQFKRVWKLRFELMTLGSDTESYLRNHTAYQARIAWDVEIGAVDYTYVVQSLSGTTAPVDE